MKLANVASYFSKDQVYDAYTSDPLFMASTSYADERGANASGVAGKHFSMTVAYGTAMPTRNAVTIFGDSYIIGNTNPDGYRGVPINSTYSIRRSTGLMSAMTPGQACLSASGIAMHAHKEYLRDNSNTQTDSSLNVFWNIFCPKNETLSVGLFLRDGNGRLFRIRNLYLLIEGFQICEADDIGPGALQAVQFTSNGVYDPVSDKFATTTVNTYGIEIDVPNAFVYRTQMESDYRPGDKTLIFPASQITPKVGGTFLMGGLSYKVESSFADQDSFLVRARLS